MSVVHLVENATTKLWHARHGSSQITQVAERPATLLALAGWIEGHAVESVEVSHVVTFTHWAGHVRKDLTGTTDRWVRLDEYCIDPRDPWLAHLIVDGDEWWVQWRGLTRRPVDPPH